MVALQDLDMSEKKADTLDKTVTFLAKRDGIDKVGV